MKFSDFSKGMLTAVSLLMAVSAPALYNKIIGG